MKVGVILSLAARGVGVLGTVGLTLLLARVYGVEYSGEFFHFYSSMAVLAVLTRLGGEHYLIVRNEPDSSISRKIEITTAAFSVVAAIFILTAVACAVLLVGNTIAPRVLLRALSGLHPVLLALSAFSLNVIWIVAASLRAMAKAELSVFVESSLIQIWLAMVVLMLYFIRVNPRIELIVVSVCALASMLGATVLILQGAILQSCMRVTLGSLRKAFGGVFAYASVTVVNSLLVWAPIQIMGFAGDKESVGIYNAGFRVAMLIGAFGVIVRSVVVKKFAGQILKDSESYADRLSHLKNSIMLGLPFFFVLFLVVVFRNQIASMYGPEFKGVEVVMVVLSLAQCINVIGLGIETKLIISGVSSVLNVNGAFMLLMIVVLSVLLVNRYGAIGGSVAFLASVVLGRVHLMVSYLYGAALPSNAKQIT